MYNYQNGNSNPYEQNCHPNKTVYLCGQVATETNEGIVAQTKSVLDKVDSLLDQAGSSKDHIHPVFYVNISPIAARHPQLPNTLPSFFWSVMVFTQTMEEGRRFLHGCQPSVWAGWGTLVKSVFKALLAPLPGRSEGAFDSEGRAFESVEPVTEGCFVEDEAF